MKKQKMSSNRRKKEGLILNERKSALTRYAMTPGKRKKMDG
jgi:hypothetical protein